MRISIRLDGYPLYAFVPEWMVVVYVIVLCTFWYAILKHWYVLKEKYNG